MFERRNDATFIRATPDINARFVYDRKKSQWKATWTDEPQRYMGYCQTEGDPIDVFDLKYLIRQLNLLTVPPEERITLQAPRRTTKDE